MDQTFYLISQEQAEAIFNKIKDMYGGDWDSSQEYTGADFVSLIQNIPVGSSGSTVDALTIDGMSITTVKVCNITTLPSAPNRDVNTLYIVTY